LNVMNFPKNKYTNYKRVCTCFANVLKTILNDLLKNRISKSKVLNIFSSRLLF
jgi:hypothetical protein